ncbi:hypothetical protein [Deinococcus sp. NW-56]|uniref:hypothetical protein n=1 Tax=Deinococcus sp. NW-56 TaxID=2080419 RepID=UPI000CF45D5F|nr:hypothetical protein [Deinococcus sp. NW-56]
MPPADLTAPEIADLLAQAYAEDQGYGHDGPSAEERTALADRLGCDETLRAEAWELLREQVIDEDAAAYWLDVEFIEPCPEGFRRQGN